MNLNNVERFKGWDGQFEGLGGGKRVEREKPVGKLEEKFKIASIHPLSVKQSEKFWVLMGNLD